MVKQINRLAWVTAREARGRDEDEQLALTALAEAGVTVDVVDWDDQDVDWAAYDRVVLRSTWDYPERLAEFLAWVDEVAQLTELVNPPALVRWSLDKRYLAELDAAGVPITPTVFVAPGTQADLPDEEFLVKPAVGAGSREVVAYGAEDHAAAAAHIARLHAAGNVALVQPFLKSVPVDGEWPMVFFEGRLSHAASKRVELPQAGAVDNLFAVETTAAHTASAEQIEAAQAAMDLVVERLGTPTYARVDLVRDNDGSYCVLELELVEPSLFLPEAEPGAADRLAAALTRTV
ncbi:hypothetical protein WBG06_11640 [Nocardioides sp. CCNWLW239]|uniref:hypothetical protein n=1 Tax=Nocardioides sp. CCNWLW239 TaxID=3128902 RepID=UPI00301AD5A5